MGNLDKKVTEYHIIKLFQQHGTIIREDFMWHMMGEMRGMPRGYAFVEMSTRKEALVAQSKLDRYDLLGRKISVRFAEERETAVTDTAEATEEENKEAVMAVTGKGVSISTKDKIRAIEEKLRKMSEGKKKKTKKSKKIKSSGIEGGKTKKQKVHD